MKRIGNLFTSKYKIGERVVHLQTGFYGRVEGIETVGAVDQLTVKLDRGTMMSKIDRREFQSANAERAQVPEIAETHAVANEFLSGLDTSKGFSQDSILEEIV